MDLRRLLRGTYKGYLIESRLEDWEGAVVTITHAGKAVWLRFCPADRLKDAERETRMVLARRIGSTWSQHE